MAIKQKTKSLSVTDTTLSAGFFQLQVLNGKELVDAKFPAFGQQIAEAGFETLTPTPLEIFQLNIGKLCNQTCAHCHVDAFVAQELGHVEDGPALGYEAGCECVPEIVNSSGRIDPSIPQRGFP